MSHELRTPLNVILGFCRDGARPEPRREPSAPSASTRIETAGRELLELIESTLEIGRFEAGRDDVRLETVALAALLGRARATAARRCRAGGGVTLEWSARSPDVALIDRSAEAHASSCGTSSATRSSSPSGDGCAPSAARRRAPRRAAGRRHRHRHPRRRTRRRIFEMFRQGDGSDSRRYGGVGPRPLHRAPLRRSSSAGRSRSRASRRGARVSPSRSPRRARRRRSRARPEPHFSSSSRIEYIFWRASVM